MKQVGEYCLFGDLKSGDRFRYRDKEWVKISGNFADLMSGDRILTTEQIPNNAVVLLRSIY